MSKTIEYYKERAGGTGTMSIEHLLSEKELGKHVTMFAKVIIDVNSSLGYHLHREDGETYYILEGVGLYNDNGKTTIVNPGDILFTPPGKSHGIENIGDIPLVFIAIILSEA